MTNFLIFAGTVSAVIFLVLSGIIYLTAGADPQRVVFAKQMLKAGLIGSLIIFGIGTILKTIELIGGGDLTKLFGG